MRAWRSLRGPTCNVRIQTIRSCSYALIRAYLVAVARAPSVLCMVPVLLSLQMRLNLSIYDAAKGLGNTSGTIIGTEIGYPKQFHRIYQTRGIVPLSLLPQPSEGETESRSTQGLVHKDSVCLRPNSLAEAIHDSLSNISGFSKSSSSRVAVMDGR